MNSRSSRFLRPGMTLAARRPMRVVLTFLQRLGGSWNLKKAASVAAAAYVALHSAPSSAGEEETVPWQHITYEMFVNVSTTVWNGVCNGLPLADPPLVPPKDFDNAHDTCLDPAGFFAGPVSSRSVSGSFSDESPWMVPVWDGPAYEVTYSGDVSVDAPSGGGGSVMIELANFARSFHIDPYGLCTNQDPIPTFSPVSSAIASSLESAYWGLWLEAELAFTVPDFGSDLTVIQLQTPQFDAQPSIASNPAVERSYYLSSDLYFCEGMSSTWTQCDGDLTCNLSNLIELPTNTIELPARVLLPAGTTWIVDVIFELNLHEYSTNTIFNDISVTLPAPPVALPEPGFSSMVFAGLTSLALLQRLRRRS